MDEIQPTTHPQGRLPVAPGLLTAIQLARGLTHFLLVVGALATFIGMNGRSGEGYLGAAICVGLFLLSYFTWGGLVLFGAMNFSLSAMLWFVMALGACIGLLMSGERRLMGLGGLGLLLMVFVAVIPISRYDPTTPPPKKGSCEDPWRSSSLRIPEARSRGTNHQSP